MAEIDRDTRLAHALDTGALALPETGSLVLFRARPEDGLASLPRARLTVVQGNKVVHDQLAGRGFTVATEAGEGHAAAIVFLPRAKAEARALIAAACAAVVPGGLVVVDGFKTDGIDSLLKDLRARVALSEPVAKAHGKLAHFAATDRLSDWAAQPTRIEGDFVTRPGVFSADGPDPASVLLAGVLPDYLPGYTVDLGAGWGYLGRAVLARKGVKRLDLVEAEADALACARENCADPRVRFVWADATQFRADGHADHVVMNPPFHTTRKADPALGAEFIATAARILSPEGDLWMVANRHLPYDAVLRQHFREVEDLGGNGTFRLTHARRPVKRRL